MQPSQTRPSFFTQTSSTRTRQTSFPALQTRGSSTTATTVSPNLGSVPLSGAWGAPVPSPGLESAAPTVQQQHRKKGPSLSFQRGPDGSAEREPSEIHPLKHTWDVYFSHRSAGQNGRGAGKKEDVKVGKEKESREEWEGTVVKLGGFSSIESLHPFLAHLTPPSALPASISTSAQLFNIPSSDSLPPPSSNVISDINIFRSPIAPLWEDPANSGGGRWVLRLRKGVSDRVWEEVVFALVGERITREDEMTDSKDSKVNGAVLSVRKDEDILSLWCAPASRLERDFIRDSLRAALEPILSSAAAAALQLDYKPHPTAGLGGAPRNNEGATNPSGVANSATRDRESHQSHSHSGHREHHNHGHGHRHVGSGENATGRDRSENANGARERPARNGGGGFALYRDAEKANGDHDRVPRERSESYNHRERTTGPAKERNGGLTWGRSTESHTENTSSLR